MSQPKIVLIHNIIAPYKTLLFNALHDLIGDSFRVLYLTETEKQRDWKIDPDTIRFSYSLITHGRLEDQSQLRLAIQTYKNLETTNPDVIIVSGYSYLAYWAALYWAKRHRKKTILLNETHYLDRPRTAVKEKIKRLFISRNDAALVAGGRHKDYYTGLGMCSDNIFVFDGVGGYDAEFYQQAFQQLNQDKLQLRKDLGVAKNNFLYVGRFAPEKNLLLLLKAYGRLRSTGITDWGLILVGGGPQKEEIETHIRDEALPDVFLPGFHEKENLLKFHAASNCFVLPSISEPWGLVVDEAMAASLPVLVSNCCGCYPDIVRDGVNGFSFDPYDADQLFRQMHDFATGKHDCLAMGHESYCIISDRTPEHSAQIFKAAIEHVLN